LANTYAHAHNEILGNSRTSVLSVGMHILVVYFLQHPASIPLEDTIPRIIRTEISSGVSSTLAGKFN
jgi:hypothetical protein